MSNNRVCKVCGKEYHYCPTCPRDNDKPSWMTRFDSEPCKKLWDILVANGGGESTDQETVQKLNSINYKSINIENDGIKAHIARLMGNMPTPAPMTKEEIRKEVTSEPKQDNLPTRKEPPVNNAQQAMSAAADSMHKNNKFKFLK